jgi:hypothetical protein
MPYEVVKDTEVCSVSKPWAVKNKNTGDLRGCHATKEHAQKQQKALYANVKDARSMGEGHAILSPLVFAEQTDTLLWLEALPAKTWHTMEFGEVDVTTETLQRMVDNFYGNVRGQEVATDFEHGRDVAKGSKASGWIREADIRNGSLWLGVEPTETAKQEIANREWKYFSLEWDDWKHPETNVIHQDVIIGGGFTNRPIAKGLVPINFSELFDVTAKEITAKMTDAEEDTEVVDESKEMEHSEPGSGSPPAPRTDEDGSDDKAIKEGWRRDQPPIVKELEDNVELDAQIREALGLAEDADIIKAVNDMKAEVEPLREAAKAMSEKKAFAEAYPDEFARLKRLEEKDRESEAKAFSERFERIGESDKGFSTVVKDKLKEMHKSFSEGTATTMDLSELMEVIASDTGIVDFTESGSSRAGTISSDPAKAFSEKVVQIQEDDKLNYGDAVAEATKRHPDLFAAYRSAVPTRQEAY